MKHPEAVSHMHASDSKASQKKHSAQMFWQRYFNFYDTLNEALPYRQMIQRQAELLEPYRGELVLDAGTGTGNVAVALLAGGAQVLGIDFCEPALVLCRQKAPQGEFRFGDLTQRLEFDDNHFDKIACCCVLHVLNRSAQEFAVRELFRVLKPGGRIVVTAFAVGFSPIKVFLATVRAQRQSSSLLNTTLFVLRYSFNTMRIMYYVSRIKRREKSGEYNFFSTDDLLQMLEQAGFADIKIERAFADQCVTAVAVKPQLKDKQI